MHRQHLELRGAIAQDEIFKSQRNGHGSPNPRLTYRHNEIYTTAMLFDRLVREMIVSTVNQPVRSLKIDDYQSDSLNKCIEEEVDNDMNDNMNDDMNKDMNEDLNNDVNNDINNDKGNEINNYMSNDVKNDMNKGINIDIGSNIHNDIGVVREDEIMNCCAV